MKLYLLVGSLIFAASTATSSAAANGRLLKKRRGKSGKSSKSSKSSSKESSVELDECVFANPTLEQAYAGLGLAKSMDCLCLKTDLESHVDHAAAVNPIYASEVKKYTDGEGEYEDIFDTGVVVGEAHPFVNTLENDLVIMLVCTTTAALVTQMEETCDYEFYEDAYEVVSKALMNGFSVGAGYDFTVDECDEDNTFSRS